MTQASEKCAPDHRSHPGSPLQIIYLTLVAALLYLASNWLVERIEMALGRRLKSRSLLFFGILMTLALATFSMIRWYTGNP